MPECFKCNPSTHMRGFLNKCFVNIYNIAKFFVLMHKLRTARPLRYQWFWSAWHKDGYHLYNFHGKARVERNLEFNVFLGSNSKRLLAAIKSNTPKTNWITMTSLTYEFTHLLRSSNISGRRKLSRDQSSARLFCSGVPVSRRRWVDVYIFNSLRMIKFVLLFFPKTFYLLRSFAWTCSKSASLKYPISYQSCDFSITFTPMHQVSRERGSDLTFEKIFLRAPNIMMTIVRPWVIKGIRKNGVLFFKKNFHANT